MEITRVPDLKDRIQAFFLDLCIMFAFMFLFYKIFEAMPDVPDTYRKGAFIFVFAIYDPLFTSLLGGTLGHRAMKLRVRRASNLKKNVLLPIALFRFAAKAFIGIISLLVATSHSEGKAIHDMLSGSIVVYRDDVAYGE